MGGHLCGIETPAGPRNKWPGGSEGPFRSARLRVGKPYSSLGSTEDQLCIPLFVSILGFTEPGDKEKGP